MLLYRWNIFAQARFADLSTETWTSQIPVVKRILSTRGGQGFWDNHHNEFETSFQAELAQIMKPDGERV